MGNFFYSSPLCNICVPLSGEPREDSCCHHTYFFSQNAQSRDSNRLRCASGIQII